MFSVAENPALRVSALAGTEAQSDLPGFPYTQVEAASAVEAPPESNLTARVTQVAIFMGTPLLEKNL